MGPIKGGLKPGMTVFLHGVVAFEAKRWGGPETPFCIPLILWIHAILRWPWELNALQLKKAPTNLQNTSKLRKHFPQFDNTCAAFRKHDADTQTCCKFRKHMLKQKRWKFRNHNGNVSGYTKKWWTVFCYPGFSAKIKINKHFGFILCYVVGAWFRYCDKYQPLT